MAWDLVVIGAGAAGLMAACRAAERGQRVLVLEKNAKPGVKILMSGGTRCNLTQATDARGIVAAFGTQGKFLHSALAALGPEELVRWFNAEGVATKIEATGKVFPVSDRAKDVLDALTRRLQRAGATLALRTPVRDWEVSEVGWTLRTPAETLIATEVLLTTGGQSYPGCGTTGDGYRLAAKLGLKIVPPRPALVPLTSPTPWVHELAGLTIPDVRVAVVAAADAPALPPALDRGSLLFTHQGLSGPVVLNVSRAVTAASDPKGLELLVDWLPDLQADELAARLRQAAAEAGRRTVSAEVAEWLPRRLAAALLEEGRVGAERRLAELTKAERQTLLSHIKGQRLPLSGTLGFPKAEVTAGGIDLDEVDSRTMRSKRHPSLLLAGEVLDLDGPIGGYNFQAAFSTGWLAAEQRRR
ncbi:MAG TPA: NAD(P)/FAD-dependent oxidoreductase [Gemmatales bacterium]|nr:NAD(P)/FAD-dependent oxidoreductase [Gemmatales bacterium]